MNTDERKIIAEAVEVMHGLRAEMQEFRGEMKGFKEQSLERIRSLEDEQKECQKNPASCATARALESHVQGHKSGKGMAVTLWSVCVSTAMCVFTIVMALIKRS